MAYDIAAAGFSMPFGASLYGPPPYEFRDAEQVSVCFTADPAGLAALLPPGLEVADDPAQCEVRVCNYHWSAFGPFHEAMHWSGSGIERARCTGTCPLIFTDNEAPLAAGRELWGYPKKLAMMTWGWGGPPGDRPANELLHFAVERPSGTTLASVTFAPERQADPAERHGLPVVSHRFLPPVAGGQGAGSRRADRRRLPEDPAARCDRSGEAVGGSWVLQRRHAQHHRPLVPVRSDRGDAAATGRSATSPCRPARCSGTISPIRRSHRIIPALSSPEWLDVPGPRSTLARPQTSGGVRNFASARRAGPMGNLMAGKSVVLTGASTGPRPRHHGEAERGGREDRRLLAHAASRCRRQSTRSSPRAARSSPSRPTSVTTCRWVGHRRGPRRVRPSRRADQQRGRRLRLPLAASRQHARTPRGTRSRSGTTSWASTSAPSCTPVGGRCRS